MKLLVREAALATAAIVAIACGGSSTGPSSDASSPRCRRYATGLTAAITSSNLPAVMSATTCAFDRATTTLRCTQTGSGGGNLCLMLTTQTTYASVADFVEEAAAVGRRRLQRMQTVLGGGCSGISFSSVYVYDAGKRLLSQTNDVESPPMVTTFGAWDTLGRPTTETNGRALCSGETWATTYDDAGRRTTSRLSSAGVGRDCASNVVVTSEYDADGNVVRAVVTAAGVTTSSQTNTITSAETVCP